jgi:hypothetical protein
MVRPVAKLELPDDCTAEPAAVLSEELLCEPQADIDTTIAADKMSARNFFMCFHLSYNF